MRRNGEHDRKNGATFARRAIVAACLAFLLFAFARLLLDRLALQRLLNDAAAARAAARFTADRLASYEPADKANLPRTRAERDSALLDAAERWLATRPDPEPARDVVERGLARWGVDRQADRQATSADRLASPERDAFSYAAERQSTYAEARDSADALETIRFDAPDPALDAALAFLQEFEPGDDSESEDAILWTYGEAGAPNAFYGLVAARDFEFDPRAVAAKRLASAAVNLFLASTLGALLLAVFGGKAFDSIRAAICAALRAARRRSAPADLPWRRPRLACERGSAPPEFLSERLLI